MTSQHNQTDNLVRAYLLGTLEEPASANFEQSYFLDKEFFGQVLHAETLLIQEYLADQLTGFDRQQFERRYFRNPLLKEKVAEVRASLGLQGKAVSGRAPGRGFLVWMIPAVAAIIMTIVVGAVFRHRTAEPYHAPTGEQKLTTSVPAIILNLSPGLMKGAAAQSAALAAPGKDRHLQLNLELPGRTKAADYNVQLLVIEPDDSRRTIWSGRSSKYSELPGSTTVTVMIPGSLVRPGDYSAEVRSLQDVILETYIFHIKSSL